MTKCPKCQSGNVYGQEGELVCMMCGKRWYPERKVVMSRIGDCVNCKRETSIVAGGLCGLCYNATHNKVEKGTAEYDAVLLKIREKFKDAPARETLKKGRPKKEAVKRVPDPQQHEDTIIETLKAKRDELMDKVFKLNQAIEVIETL